VITNLENIFYSAVIFLVCRNHGWNCGFQSLKRICFIRLPPNWIY